LALTETIGLYDVAGVRINVVVPEATNFPTAVEAAIAALRPVTISAAVGLASEVKLQATPSMVTTSV
jgi:hypothetical protein